MTDIEAMAREAVATCKSHAGDESSVQAVVADIARQRAREPYTLPATAWPLGRPWISGTRESGAGR
ncbi:hypothetical protein [Microbacterium deminutum]|uniref:Acyl-CoA carboxylase subunit epsilon n=1 Tax=Microbacterium deminutum TaxID=344164 RepID=A0ABN2QG42_9MICO